MKASKSKVVKATPFANLDFSNESVQQTVVKIFVDTFKGIKAHQREKIALTLLDQLFSNFEFDLKEFIKKNQLSPNQQTKFISYLLYCIYYNEIYLPYLSLHASKTYSANFFFVLLAQAIELKKIKTIISKMSLKLQLDLIAHCCSHMREGAWSILDIFEELYHSRHQTLNFDFARRSAIEASRSERGSPSPSGKGDEEDRLHKVAASQNSKFDAGCGIYSNDNEKLTLLMYLRRNYFDSDLLEKILLKQPDKFSLKDIIGPLEEHAQNQVIAIKEILPKLIQQIIDYPMNLWKAFTLGNALLQNANPSFLSGAQDAKNKLADLFGLYISQSYSIEDYITLFKIFGLKGYCFRFQLTKRRFPSLLEMLQQILNLLKTPAALPDAFFPASSSFILSICRQLYAFNIDPQQYVDGMNRLVYALSTRGINLSAMVWLPSVLKGLADLNTHLQLKGCGNFKLINYPIIIFDQADPKHFDKNKLFIQQMTKNFGIPILHLSKNETVQLAEKLEMKDWVQTTSEGDFGYGGARNCQLMLAPVIYRAYLKGSKTIASILEIKKADLQKLFEDAVLGQNKEDIVVHIGEDDVGILSCNFFADALFCKFNINKFFYRSSYGIGRGSLHTHSFLNIESIYEEPWLIYSSRMWMEHPEISGMRGAISKPKFCLPLPFGNEEMHVSLSASTIDYFQQPIVHLGGTRFPNKKLPISPLDGVDPYLRHLIEYSFQIDLSSSIIDSTNRFSRCILPWNDETIRSTFNSLDDVWKYRLRPDVTQELQQRFWSNLRIVFTEKRDESNLGGRVQNLLDVVLYPDIPKLIAKLYLTLQKDAEAFLALGQTALDLYEENEQDYLAKAQKLVEKQFKIDIQETQLTKSLLLLLRWIYLLQLNDRSKNKLPMRLHMGKKFSVRKMKEKGRR